MGAVASLQNPGAGRANSVPLLSGDAGVVQTIALIRSAVQEALRDPLVRATAGAIVRGLSPTNLTAQAQAIFDFVRRRVKFVRDPIGNETVSSAEWTLRHGFGDCDDQALLVAALLGAVGIDSRLVTVALDPREPDSFSHIYAEAAIAGRWIPMDTARDNARFGRGPARSYRQRIWFFEPPVHQDVQLAGYPTRLGFDIDDFLKAAGGVSSAAANVITAVRTPPYFLPQPQVATKYPQTRTTTATDFPPDWPSVGGWARTLPSWLLPAGLGLVGLMLFRGRK